MICRARSWVTRKDERLLLRQYPRLHSVVWSVAFSADGKYIASSGISRVVGLWETATGRALPSLVGHRGGVYQVAFSPDGKTLASTGEDTNILLWDVARLFGQRQPPAADVSDEELDLCWRDLGHAEEYQVRRAKELLCAAGPRTLELLQRRLPEALPLLGQVRRAEQLMAQLDSADFRSRTKASAELARLGTAARPALRKALEGPSSLEVRRRSEALLAKLPTPDRKDASDETQRALQAVAIVEWLDCPQVRNMLRKLVQQGPTSIVSTEAQALLDRLEKAPASKP